MQTSFYETTETGDIVKMDAPLSSMARTPKHNPNYFVIETASIQYRDMTAPIGISMLAMSILLLPIAVVFSWVPITLACVGLAIMVGREFILLLTGKSIATDRIIKVDADLVRAAGWILLILKTLVILGIMLMMAVQIIEYGVIDNGMVMASIILSCTLSMYAELAYKANDIVYYGLPRTVEQELSHLIESEV